MLSGGHHPHTMDRHKASIPTSQNLDPMVLAASSALRSFREDTWKGPSGPRMTQLDFARNCRVALGAGGSH